MANTLTGLTPVIYKALDTVSRELVGFIPAVFRNSSAEAAAKDQSITYPVVGAMTAAAITPAATGPDPSAQSVSNGTMTISNSKAVTFYWEGEEQKGVKSGGIYMPILQDQFAQSMRALCNEIEEDLGGLYVSASRAYGTAGTTPFATLNEMDDFSYTLKILKDNGCPMSDLHLVLDSTAVAKMGGYQANLFKVNEAGSDGFLRNGSLGRVSKFDLHESGQVQTHTKGTGAGYDTNLSGGYVAGSKTIAADTGTGTIIAGDVVSFADESPASKYVVKTALADGSFVIQNPGLMSTVGNDKDITLAANYTANMAFHRSAIHLVTRAPAMPEGGDSADDVMVIQDPVSGLAFQVAVYRQYKRVAFEVGIAWGVKAVNPEHIALLLG